MARAFNNVFTVNFVIDINYLIKYYSCKNRKRRIYVA